MRSSIVPAAEPQDTASVRSALEALRNHLRSVADRYETAADSMRPGASGSRTAANAPTVARLTDELVTSLHHLTSSLRDVPDHRAHWRR